MGRMGKNEYNNVILFLSSNASSYINGATIVVDGDVQFCKITNFNNLI